MIFELKCSFHLWLWLIIKTNVIVLKKGKSHDRYDLVWKLSTNNQVSKIILMCVLQFYTTKCKILKKSFRAFFSNFTLYILFKDNFRNENFVIFNGAWLFFSFSHTKDLKTLAFWNFNGKKYAHILHPYNFVIITKECIKVSLVWLKIKNVRRNSEAQWISCVVAAVSLFAMVFNILVLLICKFFFKYVYLKWFFFKSKLNNFKLL